MVQLAGFVHDSAGTAVSTGVTVNIYARNTVTPVVTSPTVSATGYWQATAIAEGRYDIEIVDGTTTRRMKYDDEIQVERVETAVLQIRNPADTFVYDIVPAAITAARTLNLPLITGTDTLAVLALAQTFLTGVKTFNSSILAIRNPADTFSYTVVASAITAARNLTVPLITADDTLAVLGLAQTWTGVQTFGAVTLGGTVSGGGQQLNNIIIGTVTPLAGSFTTLGASGLITRSGVTAYNTGIALTGSNASGLGIQLAHSEALSKTWDIFVAGSGLTADGTGTLVFYNETDNIRGLRIYPAGLVSIPIGPLRLGGTTTPNEFYTASQGASSTTMYIGNASINVTSDVRVKSKIEPWGGDALGLLKRLNVVEYDMDSHRPFGDYAGRHIGITAQNLYDVAPWAVNAQGGQDCWECKTGLKCEDHLPWQVKQDLLTGVYVRSFQQMDKRIHALETGLAQLKGQP